MPSKDRPGLVLRAVELALSQRGVDVEVVVIDDGSFPALALPDLPAVRLLREPISRGVAAARNRGIAEARGRWVAFLDDDDLWAPTKLEAQIDAMQQTGLRWCACGAVWVNERLAVRWTVAPPLESVGLAELRRGNALGTPSGVIVETAFLREVGGFDAQFSVFADWDLWLRLGAQSSAATVTDPLLGYMTHPGSMHRQAFRATAAELRELARVHRATSGGELQLTAMWRWLGVAQIEGGRPLTGVATLVWTAARWRTADALADVFRPSAEHFRARAGRARPAPPWLSAIRTAGSQRNG